MKNANYISHIEIASLWRGRKHIVWKLRPDVNILSGRNGEGKSTIINKLIRHIRTMPTSGELPQNSKLGVRVDFEPVDATGIRYDIIRSFDRQLVQSEGLKDVPGANIATELDWQLFQLSSVARLISILASVSRFISGRSNDLMTS